MIFFIEILSLFWRGFGRGFIVKFGDLCLREGGRRVCENPKGLSMYDGLIETVEYIWVNIWCMLD